MMDCFPLAARLTIHKPPLVALLGHRALRHFAASKISDQLGGALSEHFRLAGKRLQQWHHDRSGSCVMASTPVLVSTEPFSPNAMSSRRVKRIRVRICPCWRIGRLANTRDRPPKRDPSTTGITEWCSRSGLSSFAGGQYPGSLVMELTLFPEHRAPRTKPSDMTDSFYQVW